MRASNEQRLTSGGGSPDDTSGPSGASPGGSQSIPSHVDSQISVPLLSDARREEGFTSGYSYGTDSKQKEITGQNESKTHVLTAQEEYREYLRKQVCLCACLCVCLSIHSSVYLSVCLSVCLSVYLSVGVSVCLSVFLHTYIHHTALHYCVL